MYVFMCVSPCRSSHGVDDCPLSRCCVSVSRSFVLFSKQLLDLNQHSPRHNAVLFCLAPLCTMHCHASRHAPAPQGLCVAWRRGAFPPPPAFTSIHVPRFLCCCTTLTCQSGFELCLDLLLCLSLAPFDACTTIDNFVCLSCMLSPASTDGLRSWVDVLLE